MKIKNQKLRDVDECSKKISYILKEYRCTIEFDKELEECIIVDNDNCEYNDDFNAFPKGQP